MKGRKNQISIINYESKLDKNKKAFKVQFKYVKC